MDKIQNNYSTPKRSIKNNLAVKKIYSYDTVVYYAMYWTARKGDQSKVWHTKMATVKTKNIFRFPHMEESFLYYIDSDELWDRVTQDIFNS